MKKVVAKNSKQMKESNRMGILNLLRKKNVSRAELSRETGLTRAAISLIIDKLLEEGIVYESSVEEAEIGRKPIQLQINEDRYYALGLDISRDHSYLGALNIAGKLIVKEHIEIGKDKNAYETLDIIAKRIEKMQSSKDLKGEFLGLGISSPGPIDIGAGKILNPPNYKKWHNIEIVRYLKNTLNCNVFLDNNAIAQTLVEKYFGIGTSYHNYIVMMINAGIGAGIVVNDQLYRGVNGFGNEVGHITVDINGKQCDCGNYGCLELYAGMEFVLDNPSLKKKGIDTWEGIVDRAMAGDPECLGIIKNEAHYLSTGIVTCLNMLELEAIILKGSISYRSDMLLDEIKKTVWRHTITRNYRENVPIYITPDIEENEIIAAATIVFDRFFNSQI